MNRIVLGAVLALVLAGVGLFWWQGRAEIESNAPPPPDIATGDPAQTGLPITDGSDMKGPAPPQASELTREQRRFFRYDRNRDWRISRSEMLSTRADAFRKLDVDGNNLLTFEEWAVATSNRFKGADADGDGELTPAEFATTAPSQKKRPGCRC